MSTARFWSKKDSVLPVIPRWRPVALHTALESPGDLKDALSKTADLRPKLPFWRTPEHRIPTLWTLYRAILQGLQSLPEESQSGEPDPITSRARARAGLRADWRRHRQLTSPAKAREFLAKQYEVLSDLEGMLAGATSRPTPLIARYLRYPSIRPDSRDKARLDPSHLIPKNSKRQPRIVGFLRPTLHNPPLPRMKPQPIGLGMMIHHRIRARENRRKRWAETVVGMEDMVREEIFWSGLGIGEGGDRAEGDVTADLKDDARDHLSRGKPGYKRPHPRINRPALHPSSTSFSPTSAYLTHHAAHLASMETSFQLDERRAKMTYTVEMIKRVMAAKRERARWKEARAIKLKARVKVDGESAGARAEGSNGETDGKD